MRAFSFLLTSRLRALGWSTALVAAAGASYPGLAAAQWPAELHLTVTDGMTGAPVVGATVAWSSGGGQGLTDARGSVRLQGLDPGAGVLTVRALGFHRRDVELVVRNGQRRLLTLTLTPDPLSVRGVSVTSAPRRTSGVHVFDRTELERSGARTLGELLARAPGVVVRGDDVGGRQEISIRGSAPDAVLVLLDGTPLNNPVTGVADLSLVGLGDVDQVRVLSGARSARYGPRALAGVVEVSRRQSGGRRLALESNAGSLGVRGGALVVSGGDAGAGQRLALDARRLDGDFSFEMPPEVGGGRGTRTNADAQSWGAAATIHRVLDAHMLSARFELRDTNRGLPGKAFQQADSSRQEVSRLGGSMTWSTASDRFQWVGLISAVWQDVRFRDPAPPLGVPFDDRTRFRQSAAQLDGSSTWGANEALLVGFGARLEGLGVDGSQLSTSSGANRATNGGVHLHTRWQGGGHWTLSAAMRVDRGLGDGAVVSHSLTAGLAGQSGSAAFSHRSAFSPPSLGDQFFREGVGVRANPDLTPERVPSEWELWGALHLGALDLGGSAYAGDVRGMIVWLPDFQFIWSPRNTDVHRKGMDLWAAWTRAPAGFSVQGRYSYARVTYDRVSDDSVQLAYRPRHTAGVEGTWSNGPWGMALGGDFTGTRYPVPAAINALAPFWAWRASLTRQWSGVRWNGQFALHVDRLFDSRDTLIFGFPSPGRTLRLTARIGL